MSVVATGIDAVANAAEPPVKRRTLAEPLAPEAAPEPQPEPAPHRPAFEAPAAAVAAAPAPTTANERDLIDVMEGQTAAQAPATDDGLPPPAYQPAAAAPAPEPQPTFSHAAPQGRPMPGTPTPEALARLERVTGRAPGSMQGHVPGEARIPRQQPAPVPASDVEADRPRFGINSLINKMSGAVPGLDQRAETPRHQPTVSSHEAAPEPSPEQERIEIPAFLRRQAN